MITTTNTIGTSTRTLATRHQFDNRGWVNTCVPPLLCGGRRGQEEGRGRGRKGDKVGREAIEGGLWKWGQRNIREGRCERVNKEKIRDNRWKFRYRKRTENVRRVQIKRTKLAIKFSHKVILELKIGLLFNILVINWNMWIMKVDSDSASFFVQDHSYRKPRQTQRWGFRPQKQFMLGYLLTLSLSKS